MTRKEWQDAHPGEMVFLPHPMLTMMKSVDHDCFRDGCMESKPEIHYPWWFHVANFIDLRWKRFRWWIEDRREKPQ